MLVYYVNAMNIRTSCMIISTNKHKNGSKASNGACFKENMLHYFILLYYSAFLNSSIVFIIWSILLLSALNIIGPPLSAI